MRAVSRAAAWVARPRARAARRARLMDTVRDVLVWVVVAAVTWFGAWEYFL